MKEETIKKCNWAILIAMAIALAFWLGWAEKHKQETQNRDEYIITPSINFN